MVWQKGMKKVPGSGTKKGQATHKTRDVRMAIAKVLSDNSDNFGKWLTEVAEGKRGRVKNGYGKTVDMWLIKPDPARAVEIAMNMAEYHIPKLARTELTGANGGPVIVQSTPTDEAL